jgi:hypothetical protein
VIVSRRENALGEHSSPTTPAKESGGDFVSFDGFAVALGPVLSEETGTAAGTVIDAEAEPLDDSACVWFSLCFGTCLQPVKNATPSSVIFIGPLTCGYPPVFK